MLGLLKSQLGEHFISFAVEIKHPNYSLVHLNSLIIFLVSGQVGNLANSLSHFSMKRFHPQAS